MGHETKGGVQDLREVMKGRRGEKLSREDLAACGEYLVGRVINAFHLPSGVHDFREGAIHYWKNPEAEAYSLMIILGSESSLRCATFSESRVFEKGDSSDDRELFPLRSGIKRVLECDDPDDRSVWDHAPTRLTGAEAFEGFNRYLDDLLPKAH